MAPEWQEDVRFLVDALDERAVIPRVLKAVPENLLASPELVRLLNQEQEKGAEIVLHGYTHRRGDHWHSPWPRRLRAMLFAHHAAEFLTLTATEMEQRLFDGRDTLRRAGLRVSGFCAPGWLESSDTAPILRRLGFRYDIRMTHVLQLSNGRRIWTDWVGYMGSDGLQERLVGIANQLNRLGAPGFPVVKVFLHPQGARRSAACRKVLALIPKLMQGRGLVTYEQLVAE